MIKIESGLLKAALAATMPEILQLELPESSIKAIMARLQQVGTAEAEFLSGELRSALESGNDDHDDDIQGDWFSAAAGDDGGRDRGGPA